MTPTFRNPVVWLLRVRKRRGYGVHSPFAFNLLENVVYERLPYYAFAELDSLLNWKQRFRVRRYLHLLFRLANYHHPDTIVMGEHDDFEYDYLTSACPEAKVTQIAENKQEYGDRCIIFLSKPNNEVLKNISTGTMLLLANVNEYQEWWDKVPGVITFDLYDLGIAFFDTQYNKQNYVINF